MASKRNQRRRGCEGKKRYDDRNAAQRGVYGTLRWNEQNAAFMQFGQLEPYRCPHCGGWHIGHRPGGSAPRPRRKDMPKHAIR